MCHPANFPSIVFEKNTVISRKILRGLVADHLNGCELFESAPDPAEILVEGYISFLEQWTRILWDDTSRRYAVDGLIILEQWTKIFGGDTPRWLNFLSIYQPFIPLFQTEE